MARCPRPGQQRHPTIPHPLITTLLAIIEWAFIAAAFTKNNNFSRFKSSRSSAVPTLFYSTATKNTNDAPISGEDGNATIDNDYLKKIKSNNKCAVVFLHGLGDSPDGWSTIAEALPKLRPSLAKLDITYVFPPAQLVAITVNGGEKMPGWFDVFDWPIGVDAKDDPKGLAMSVKRVENIVTQLKEEEGIDPSKVVLGGFSQGGAVAIMAAYNRRKKDSIPFAGCICMSGWLPMKDYLDISEEAAKATPLFWAHGQYDDKILFEQQIYGVNKLESVGVDVTSYSYPVGHESSNFEEIEDMAIFLESVLCPQSKTGKVPKFAQVDTDVSSGSATNDDETNALLYYLCAIGMAENDATVGATKSIPTMGNY